MVRVIETVYEAAVKFLDHRLSAMRHAGQVLNQYATSLNTLPASRRQCTRSSNNGISSSVAERKTCFSSSSVHSSSSFQKSGLVIGISVSLS